MQMLIFIILRGCAKNCKKQGAVCRKMMACNINSINADVHTLNGEDFCWVPGLSLYRQTGCGPKVTTGKLNLSVDMYWWLHP